MRRALPLVVVVAVFAAVFAAVESGASPSANRAAEDGQWLTYGRDATLSNSTATILHAAGLKIRWRRQLDAVVYGSPVYLDNTVFVATEAGSVYALNAATGAVRWRRSLNAVQKLTDGCGSWGITSTPVIDPSRNALFLIGGDGLLHELDLASGRDVSPYPLQLITRPSVEYVWGGLRIIGGYLYAGVASYCDEKGSPAQTADGRVIAFDLAGRRSLVLDTVRGPGNLGGVWGYGGVSSDGTYLYTAVGNAFSPDGDGAGYGDHVIRFTPAPGLKVVASNRPNEVPTGGDEDFGATPVLFQPRSCPPLAAANNKVGYAFVWLRKHISDGPLTSFGLADAVSPFLGAPAWSDEQQLLVFSAAKIGKVPGAEGVAALKVIGKCRFIQLWRTATGRGVQPPPIVVGDLVFTPAGSGGIVALDARTGKIAWRQRTIQPASAPLIEADARVFAPVGNTIEAIADR